MKHLVLFMVASVLICCSAGAALAASPAYDVPESQKAAWARSLAFLAQELAVCEEHCGNDAACVDKCRQVHDHRMDFEYKRLTAGKADVGEDWVCWPSCPLCGMNREKFQHSRMLLEYDDGTVFPSCSLHCAAADIAINLDRVPDQILVADYDTHALINAETATWVIGGDVPGVMTKQAKWAFADKPAAEAFVKAHGGSLATFDAAIKASFEDMYQDTKMIREKRKLRRAKMEQAPAK